MVIDVLGTHLDIPKTLANVGNAHVLAELRRTIKDVWRVDASFAVAKTTRARTRRPEVFGLRNKHSKPILRTLNPQYFMFSKLFSHGINRPRGKRNNNAKTLQKNVLTPLQYFSPCDYRLIAALWIKRQFNGQIIIFFELSVLIFKLFSKNLSFEKFVLTWKINK